MSYSVLTEVCKQDGKMTTEFVELAQQKGSKIYNVCEYTGLEILLKKPEYRNHVKYRVKTKGEED